MRDARQQAADRAGPEVHRRVDGKRRRRLGGAVALENADAELLEPDAARLGLDALGAGEHVAHRIEVVVVGHARVAGQERVGAEQDRGVDAVGQLRHRPVVQRRRIEERAHAAEQRQQQPAGQAEAVEHRQRVEHHVARLMSTTAASWWRLASRLRWLSTTPFGVPSEPDVNSTTAGSCARAASARRGPRNERPQRATAARPTPISRAQVLEVDDRRRLGERR